MPKATVMDVCNSMAAVVDGIVSCRCEGFLHLDLQGCGGSFSALMTVFGSGTTPQNCGSPFDGSNPLYIFFTALFLNPTACTAQERGEESLAAKRSQLCLETVCCGCRSLVTASEMKLFRATI